MEGLYDRLAEAIRTIQNSGVKKAYVTVTTDVPQDDEIARYKQLGIPIVPNLYRGNAINLKANEYSKVVGIIGEYGVSALDGNGNDVSAQQAESTRLLVSDVIRLINENRLNGAIYFQFQQDPTKRGAVEIGFGLFDSNGNPLPASEEFTNAMNSIADGYHVTIKKYRLFRHRNST